MRSVRYHSDTDKIGCAHFTDFFVNGKIAIRKQRKRYIIFFLKKSDFKGRIPHANADQFNLALELSIIFNFAVHFIDRRSLPLAKGSVHAEYFYNYNLSFNVRYFKRLFPGKS